MPTNYPGVSKFPPRTFRCLTVLLLDNFQGPPAHGGVTSYPVRFTDGSIEIEC